jgi:hypothetical protein
LRALPIVEALMRLGVGRLLLAIASVAVRMAGEHTVADMLALAFFASATFNLYRTGEIRSAVRTVRS